MCDASHWITGKRASVSRSWMWEDRRGCGHPTNPNDSSMSRVLSSPLRDELGGLRAEENPNEIDWKEGRKGYLRYGGDAPGEAGGDFLRRRRIGICGVDVAGCVEKIQNLLDTAWVWDCVLHTMLYSFSPQSSLVYCLHMVWNLDPDFLSFTIWLNYYSYRLIFFFGIKRSFEFILSCNLILLFVVL